MVFFGLFFSRRLGKIGQKKTRETLKTLISRALVGEGGFEPPKSLTTDLQSVYVPITARLFGIMTTKLTTKNIIPAPKAPDYIAP